MSEYELEGAFRAVEERVQAACKRVGRARAEVRLIAVSKKKPVAAMLAARRLGQREFGENYVQELVEKHAALGNQVRLHMIGRIQSNKVKDIVGIAACVHTLDSRKLIEAFERRAQILSSPLPVMIAVNLGIEEQKGGCTPEELPALIDRCRGARSLDLQGLMTLPPQAEDPEDVRPYFRQLKQLAVRFELPRLSMGMSADFEIAIEEGATDVRVGSSLFGVRA